MLIMYFLANSIKAAAAEEKICSFFHASAVVAVSAGENGINRSPL